MPNKDKYIDLLLNRCLDLSRSNSLFIMYNKEHQSFVDDLVEEAKKLGITDFGFDCIDNEILIEKLINESVEEIKNDSYFSKKNWDVYAEKKAAFLILDTEYPKLFKNIEPSKIAAYEHMSRSTKPLYKKYQNNGTISWNISALANEEWAKEVFGDIPNSYELLVDAIDKACMLDKEDPTDEWNKFLEKQNKVCDYLNNLEIESLHYENSKGTNLTIYMPKNYLFLCASKGVIMIENMPSYEVFSSPNYLLTEGIVYNTKPLIYSGKVIDDFYIEFKDGKVINYDAKKNKELLKTIIEIDSNSCYLGEVALVDHNSPISNTNIIFKTTLFDENASCHLALGLGFSECIKEGITMTKEELLSNGINYSETHVDFMIGSHDMKITAKTKDKEVVIMQDGNIVI